jgi:hypothetical protein
MQNHNLRCRVRITRQSAESISPVQAGYDEIRRGLPLNPDKYATQVDQGNYELGRLRAVNIMAAGLPLPTWNYGKRIPNGVVAAIRTAVARIGPATDTRRMREEIRA